MAYKLRKDLSGYERSRKLKLKDKNSPHSSPQSLGVWLRDHGTYGVPWDDDRPDFWVLSSILYEYYCDTYTHRGYPITVTEFGLLMRHYFCFKRKRVHSGVLYKVWGTFDIPSRYLDIQEQMFSDNLEKRRKYYYDRKRVREDAPDVFKGQEGDNA